MARQIYYDVIKRELPRVLDDVIYQVKFYTRDFHAVALRHSFGGMMLHLTQTVKKGGCATKVAASE